jgi:hypothetical protein
MVSSSNETVIKSLELSSQVNIIMHLLFTCMVNRKKCPFYRNLSMKKFTIIVLALFIISGCQGRYYVVEENTKISNQQTKKDDKEMNNHHNLDDHKSSLYLFR